MRIELAVEATPSLRGSLRVLDLPDANESTEFVGWLGLIHALSRYVESTQEVPAASQPAD